MTSERFQINKSTIIEDAYILEDKNKKYTLVNDHKILKDFIDICNRVQYEVLNNKDDDGELVKLAGIIQDMLQNMNVEVK